MPKHDQPKPAGAIIHTDLALVLQASQAAGQQWDMIQAAAVEHLQQGHPRLALEPHTLAFNEAVMETIGVYSRPCPTSLLPLLCEVLLMHIFGSVEACIEAEHREQPDSAVSSDPLDVDLQIVQSATSAFHSILHQFLIARLTARAEQEAATKH